MFHINCTEIIPNHVLTQRMKTSMHEHDYEQHELSGAFPRLHRDCLPGTRWRTSVPRPSSSPVTEFLKTLVTPLRLESIQRKQASAASVQRSLSPACVPRSSHCFYCCRWLIVSTHPLPHPPSPFPISSQQFPQPSMFIPPITRLDYMYNLRLSQVHGRYRISIYPPMANPKRRPSE